MPFGLSISGPDLRVTSTSCDLQNGLDDGATDSDLLKG
jgi:hypothetical protein